MEDVYKKIINRSLEGYAYHKIICDENNIPTDYIFLDCNHAFEKYTGLQKRKIEGKTITEMIPNIKNDTIDWIAEYGDVALNQTEKEFEGYSESLKHHYRIKAFSPRKGYFITLFHDITEYKNRLEKYFQEVPYGIFLIDKHGNFKEVNKEIVIMTGYRETELIKMNICELLREGDTDKAKESLGFLLKSNKTSCRLDLSTKNGESRRWFAKTSRLDNEIYLGFAEDITEKTKQEEEADRLAEKTKALFDNAGIGIGYFDTSGMIISLNNAAAKNLGGKPKDFEGKNILDLFTTEDAKEFAKRLKVSVETKEMKEYEDQACLHIGEGWFKSTYNNIYDKSNNLLGVEIISQNITDLKSAQKALQERESRYRLLFEDAPMGYQSLDKNGYFIDVNDAWLNMLGYHKDEVIGKWFGDFIIPKQVDLFKKNFLKFKEAGCIHVIFRMLKKNRDVIVVNFNGRIAYEKGGRFKQTHCILEDITERLDSEEKLRKNEERLRRSQEIAKTGSWEIETGSQMIWASEQAFKIFGLAPDTNMVSVREIESMVYEEDQDLVHNTLIDFIADRKGYDIQYRIWPKDSEKISYVRSIAEKEYDAYGNPTRTLGVVMDVTQQALLQRGKDKAEAMLRNQQKLESIGTLASGVAHEINNPINGVLNYAQIILDASANDSQTYKISKEIIQETTRVSEIVKNLLEFSRQSGQHHSYADINDIITKTLSLVNTIFKHENITLNADISPNISKIKCRSQQIQQVLMNLLTNARDSLNEKYPTYDENKIINLKCNEVLRRKRKWISISVEDLGMGIPETIKSRIYDPFFTTKAKEKGTGLGLSISYGIIKEHHGEIKLKSKEGEYTQFTVNLPCDNGWEVQG